MASYFGYIIKYLSGKQTIAQRPIMKRCWTAYQGGVQRAGVLRGVGRGGALGEHEVLLDEEDRKVLFVDRDPVALPPVQVFSPRRLRGKLF